MAKSASKKGGEKPPAKSKAKGKGFGSESFWENCREIRDYVNHLWNGSETPVSWSEALQATLDAVKEASEELVGMDPDPEPATQGKQRQPHPMMGAMPAGTPNFHSGSPQSLVTALDHAIAQHDQGGFHAGPGGEGEGADAAVQLTIPAWLMSLLVQVVQALLAAIVNPTPPPNPIRPA